MENIQVMCTRVTSPHRNGFRLGWQYVAQDTTTPCSGYCSGHRLAPATAKNATKHTLPDTPNPSHVWGNNVTKAWAGHWEFLQPGCEAVVTPVGQGCCCCYPTLMGRGERSRQPTVGGTSQTLCPTPSPCSKLINNTWRHDTLLPWVPFQCTLEAFRTSN